MVVAVVARAPDGKVLLAKRAIEPRLGTWGIPQGFMELGETTREAAAREAFEETGAVLNLSEMALLALYNLPGQVQVVYEAPLPQMPNSKRRRRRARKLNFSRSPTRSRRICAFRP